jgi:hypothetical protein
VSIGGADFLLATEARLKILTPNNEMKNDIVYSACHEFVGLSTLTFLTFDPPEPGRSRSPIMEDSAIPAFVLPPDLPFKLTFMDRIDSAVAAGGDPIKGKLTTAIRDGSSKVLVPEGAAVRGHIVEIKRLYEAKSLIIGVKLETVEFEGTSRPFRARPYSGVRTFVKGTRALHPRVELGPLDLTQDRQVCVFRFSGAAPHYVVMGGLESDWWTVAP